MADNLAKKTILQMQEERRERTARLEPFVPRVLEMARDLLADRSRWTIGTLARNGAGRTVRSFSPEAEQWCAVGAIEKCAYLVIEREAAETQGVSPMGLANLAQERFQPVLAQVASEITKGRTRPHDNIPMINDQPRNGGYKAVIQALMVATGAVSEVSEAVEAYARQQAERRRAAALKAWRTRRDSRLHDQAVAEAAETPMVFGGTLPTTTAPEERSAIRIG